MNEKPWKVIFSNEPYYTYFNGIASNGIGFYKILFKDKLFGKFGEKSLDSLNTEEILYLIEQILNEAHKLYITKNNI